MQKKNLTQSLLLIDLDNTVWQFAEPLLDRYNNFFGTNILLEEMTEYDFSSKLQIPLEEFFMRFLTEDYFRTFKPYENAIETINELYFKKRAIIKFCTAAAPRTARWRLEKLESMFGWFTARDLILCKDKQMVRGNFLIDDCLDNFKIHPNGIAPTYRPIIPDWPWNRNEEELEECYHNPIRMFEWNYDVLSYYIEKEKWKRI